MKIEQIYTGCLSHAAYFLESEGEVAIFDPLRDVDSYISKAEAEHAKIKYVFETHFHADFVSGHLELKDKTGADIVFGPTAKPSYNAIVANDGDVFYVGKCMVKVIHTPGHTMESTTYLIFDENGNQNSIITGDTLFIGDVGRPDLAQHVNSELTQDKLARLLFHSLREKIMPLDDYLIVYPNHGAGSACGKMMSKETTDTLGHQKETNYALRKDMTEDEFVSELLSGLTDPPGYFPKNVLLNINGYNHLDSILIQGKNPLTVDDFLKMTEADDVMILDTRNASAFAQGFIPGSLNVGLDGSFATWVGEMISDINQKIILVTDAGREEESIVRLSRVGYDNTIGYLKGGFDAWKNAGKNIETVERISAEKFKEIYDDKIIILDVRKNSEFESEHVVNAINIPLNKINSHFDSFPKDKPFIVYCAGGYRSMIAASILKQNGFKDFADVTGGFADIRKNDLPRTAYSAPTTLL
ncbi:MBL fold metallo-hydrolase [Chryseobacterium taichungense]|uniref:MBL fold metallo-hydrolase n=1 Tax=Chryseobacterium taichungense TaxID=295069 RepID=UPI0028AB672E|nr:MBL fold metallo-hydrolase [Chryseobacterium taichungense]